MMKSEDTDECCYSRTEVKKYTYKWVITKFLDRTEKNGRFLTSSKFKSDESDKYEWYLHLYPKGDGEKSKGFISIYLLREINGPQIIPQVTFNVYFLNKKGDKVSSVSTKYPEDLDSKSFGWPQFIKRECLKLEGLLPNGNLTIFCTLGTTRYVQKTNKKIDFKIPECRMAEDFGELLLSEELSDITLSVKGQDFKAHKAILAARSPVFAAMLKHDMQEVRNNQVVIQDTEPEVFQQMLKFIYTGSRPNMKEFCDKLLVVSDKYDLARLKTMCEEALVKRLTVENAADTLMLADLHSTQQLADRTIAFITSNYAAVKQTNGWMSLARMNPILGKLIDGLVKPE